ncbi:methyltransferase type 11 [Longibacter salinarum]|uniref:Methyltransferase type 11 n=1 Tax=Longibacter salinarum TaxID=1850348 RepID=A0A2A8D0F0_9BACT|nr:class I SAM-dependent methyltransferase [Longibacter salinarum]PEN14425.1 methyltransferase type 11 [Longibacter salinarum]
MANPYDALAEVYDAAMAHVDYDRWARYVHQCLQVHGDEVISVLELGGGTGSLARRLQPLGNYEYVLTDGAAAMVEQARAKLDAANMPATCATAGFTTVTLAGLERREPFDAVVLVYDGLNYLTETEEVRACLERVKGLLREGGIAVIDHATPANSEDHEREFFDRGTVHGMTYSRHSEYDADTGLHRTTFDVVKQGRHFHEEHVQRTYAPHTIADLISGSDLKVEAAYDAFSFDSAHDRSHRVHWVLRKGT